MNDRGRKQDSFVDELLEASLARYQSEEPRPGLETRVLAGVRAKGRMQRRRSWILALTGAAAAMMFIVATARRPPPPPALVATRPGPHSDGPRPALPPDAIQPKRRSGVVVRLVEESSRRARSVQRRPEQFPTPAPLSMEERLLLAYVSQAAKSDLSKPIVRDSEIEPLEIPQLMVAMIEIKELPGPMN